MAVTTKVDVAVVRQNPDVRAARRLQFAAILAQEAGVDLKKTPADQVAYAIATPYERRGYNSAVIENWIQSCDPEIVPSWDPVACFRAQARAALKPRMGLGGTLAIIGGAAFLGSFVLSRRAR
jgi:hypothetical protein